eukprot:TRINITY_DN14308_c0_g1_i1.p1 TRINITY_DN14308_c0_g1~~TRINITY_DN14308_c0_g1_i1.p1  ORF type:complete len:546 (-),score=141.87 TRINITY_DN14308_c0_g1_i1:37-1653(-)
MSPPARISVRPRRRHCAAASLPPSRLRPMLRLLSLLAIVSAHGVASAHASAPARAGARGSAGLAVLSLPMLALLTAVPARGLACAGAGARGSKSLTALSLPLLALSAAQPAHGVASAVGSGAEGSESLAELSATLASEIAALLNATGSAFEHGWHQVKRDKPLLPIDLNDVEAWLEMEEVAPDDVEVFASPPAAQAGSGGNFDSSPRPVPEQRRLERVRKAFGGGRALVINSLHRWCPKAASLAAALKDAVGLPIDVYMYLTPPYSHSYGLHADVMDAFMVQLVGRKKWKACDREGRNCSDMELSNGDVLYLPMGAKHSAWTGHELSAHLTVNVERQFYVWGSFFQALANRFLLPKASRSLDSLRDMQHFGMEGGSALADFVAEVGRQVPELLVLPSGLMAHLRSKKDGFAAVLSIDELKEEWLALLQSVEALKLKHPLRIEFAGESREFKTGHRMVRALRKVEDAPLREGLRWAAALAEGSIAEMHAQHAELQKQFARQSSADDKQRQKRQAEQLSRLAEERATAIARKQGKGGQEL